MTDTSGITGSIRTRRIDLDLLSVLGPVRIEAVTQLVRIFGNQRRHYEILEAAARRVHVALADMREPGRD